MNNSDRQTLIALRDVSRHYQTGDETVKALDGVSLTIEHGEFVAVMGQSGSGKSTLMNILGCLDRPTGGEYKVNGHNVADLTPDQLAALRLKTFGFVFQRYQLLANLTAQENVALPAVYAHTPKEQREQRAAELLDKLGVGVRMHHTPSEMSGGQQQRVSIARAMINGAEVILADEPTGALDSATGVQVLDMLKQLNEEGVTVILITHDAEVAEHAKRQIHIHDGKIQSDSAHGKGQTSSADAPKAAPAPLKPFRSVSALVSIGTALQSLKNNWFRTLLTLLGIVIGVAAVVAMMAIGEGGKQQVLQRIESMGTNLLLIRPGGGNNRNSGDTATLSVEDAAALAKLPGIEAAAPERNTRATVRFGSRDFRGRARAITPDYLVVKDWSMSQGTFFTEDDMSSLAPVVVIGQTIVDQLFVNGENPIGQYVFLSNGIFQVVGVLEAKGAAGGEDMDEEILIPLTTGMVRIFGREYLSSITVSIEDTDEIEEAEALVTQVLTQRHGAEDFTVRNTASLIEAITETQDTLTWLLGSVAAISLFVGGIGVMNIMLVSVSERRREIGLRIATGAKPGDILQQFNIEALVVCCLGGVVGLVLGGTVAFIIGQMNIAIAYSLTPPVMAFVSAVLVGLVFGHAPARKASRLNPIDALAED